ncbi:MAG: type II toxin-antitoxin system HigA family antitoxin [Microcystaceae cyanobacterium]
MTVTFDSEKYKGLLLQYQPKIIRTEAENEQALAIVEELMHRQRTPEEDELYELLIWLIERFEQEFYGVGEASSPYSLLLFLMEQGGFTWEDLRAILGENSLAEIRENQREINSSEADKLGTFFKVSSSLFIQ